MHVWWSIVSNNVHLAVALNIYTNPLDPSAGKSGAECSH